MDRRKITVARVHDELHSAIARINAIDNRLDEHKKGLAIQHERSIAMSGVDDELQKKIDGLVSAIETNMFEYRASLDAFKREVADQFESDKIKIEAQTYAIWAISIIFTMGLFISALL